MDSIKKLDGLIYKLRAYESQYFDRLGKILGKLQDFDEGMAESIKHGREKWRFDGFKEIVNATAAVSTSAIGAGIGEASAAGSKAIDAAKGTIESYTQSWLMNSDSGGTRIKSNLGEIMRLRGEARGYRSNISSTLDAIERLARDFAGCMNCSLTKPSAVPKNSNPDPSNSANAGIKSMHDKAASRLSGGGSKKCDVCAAVQSILDYVSTKRYIIAQREALAKNAIRNQTSINEVALRLLKLLSRPKWDSGFTGHVLDVLTAVGGPVAVIARSGVGAFVNYRQSEILSGPVKSMLRSIKSMQRNLNEVERMNQDWKYTETALDNAAILPLWDFHTGKCAYPCNPTDKTTDGDTGGGGGETIIGGGGDTTIGGGDATGSGDDKTGGHKGKQGLLIIPGGPIGTYGAGKDVKDITIGGQGGATDLDEIDVGLVLVIPGTGNNPFDADDPTSGGDTTTGRLATTGSGGSTTPTISDFPGTYTGNSGCGFGSVVINSANSSIVNATFPGNSATNFDSGGGMQYSASGLVIFGVAGHLGVITVNSNYTSFTFDGSRPGASCTETFSK